MALAVLRRAARRFNRLDWSSKRQQRIVCGLLGCVMVVCLATGSVTAAVATWIGTSRWIFMAIDLLFLLALLAGLAHCYLYNTNSVMPCVLVIVTLLCGAANQFVMRQIPSVLYVTLCAAFLPVVIDFPRPEIKRVVPGCVAAIYLFFAVAYGLELPLFPPWLHTPLRSLHIFWTLLASGMLPCCLIAGLTVMDWQLSARRLIVQATLERLALQQNKLEQEQQLSRKLLHNILPKEIAQQCIEWLRHEADIENLVVEDKDEDRFADVEALPERRQANEVTRAVVARSHISGTVVFADICGFTSLCSRCDAVSLVAALNTIFSSIDEECLQRKVEKIKTIGDCYMACSVASDERVPAECAYCVLLLARSMHRIAPQTRISGSSVQVRAGIHSGALVSGVIGRTKLCYDLWGDTVNVASRMESTGLPGKTQISAQTRELLSKIPVVSERYVFQARGKQQLKGKDAMETYLVEERWSVGASNLSFRPL